MALKYPCTDCEVRKSYATMKDNVLECDFDRIATGLKRAYEFLEVKAFSDKECTRHAEMIKDAYMYLLKLHEVNADDEEGDGNAR